MKTILRVLTLGLILTATMAVSVFAQDVCTEVEAKQALYKQFTDNYAGTLDQKKTAVTAGEKYVAIYGTCADDKAIVDYLNSNIPAMKKFIDDTTKKNSTTALYKRFDTAIDSGNTAEILASGKEILAGEPDFLDVNLTLASAGFDQSVANPPNDTYNDQTLNYSKAAIAQLEANKTSKTGDYGVKKYSYKTKEFGGKENALGLMNYNIGYILYYRQGKDNPAKKKEALPYFYKATQYNAFSKTDPFVYQTIGAWYLDQAIKLDADRLAKVKAANNTDTPETLEILAMQKGYADRSIDAYARAYKLANAGTDKARATALYDKLKQLYAFRYDNKTEGIDAYVATVLNKPLPDPTTEITPVKEQTPAAATTTSTTKTTTTMTSDTTSENTAGMAKPATKTTVTTTNSKATPTGTTTTTKSKTVVTPTPKKKNNR